MSGKRSAEEPSGGAADTHPSTKRQARVDADATGGTGATTPAAVSAAEQANVKISFTMLGDPRVFIVQTPTPPRGGEASASRKAALEASAVRTAALEAALSKVVSEWGFCDVRVVQAHAAPNEDTLQRVLPLVLEHIGAVWGWQCFRVCKSWRRELEARGVCSKTVQLCCNLAGGNGKRLRQKARQRLDLTSGDAERAMCRDANAFLQRSKESKAATLPEWLQAASQEPDASFFSRGAVSTAQVFGLPLVQWVGKPQGLDPGSYTLGHSGGVSSLAFSPDGKRVVTGSTDSLVKIWDVATGAQMFSLGEHNSEGRCICAVDDEHIHPECPLPCHSGNVSWVAFAPDGKHVMSGSADHVVKIWNVETRAEVCTLRGDTGGDCASFAISPDGRYIVSAVDDYDSDGHVKIWNVAAGAEMHTLRGHTAGVCSFSFTPDGNHLVSGLQDCLVKIWNVATGAEVRTLTGHDGAVATVAISPDGKRVASGAYDELVKIWDFATGAEILSLDGHSKEAHRVEFSDDGEQVISSTTWMAPTSEVLVWDVASGRPVRQLAGWTFALVGGLSDEQKRGRHLLTIDGDKLLIYECGKEQQHGEDSAGAAPVACFKAPQRIRFVQCRGAAICVGCSCGTVCILSAPFLAT